MIYYYLRQFESGGDVSMLLQVLVGALVTGAIYGAIGVGYSVIYKASGLMSLAQGDMLMIGAFMGLTFYKYIGLPFWLTIICVIIFMFFLGMLIQSGMVATLLKRTSSAAYVILLTLALAMLLQNAAMLIWGSILQQFPSVFTVRTAFTLGGVGVAPEQLLIIIIGIICMFGLQIYLNKAKFGTAMRAAALDQKAASAVGINVPFTKGVAWGIACAIAGVIGCVCGPVYGVIFNMGASWGNKAFSGAVVGGYGNMYGAIIGGLIFALVESFTTAYISSIFKDFISFAVLIIVLVIMPSGIFKAEVLE